MNIADIWSKLSTCNRRSVGCVIVSPNGHVLSSGYNGAPRGMVHCLEAGCIMENGHCIRSIHAEMNAIAWAARVGANIEGGTVYSTSRPCIRCFTLLVQAGITKVYYRDLYDTDDFKLVKDLAAAAGIEIRRIA